jgi:hypothetical protein
LISTKQRPTEDITSYVRRFKVVCTRYAGLSHRTSFGKITAEGRRPDASRLPSVRTNVRVGRPPADGTSGRSVGRPSGRHLVDGHRTAWRTAIRPPIARSDRRLDGGRPRHPPVGVAVGRPGGRPSRPLRLGRPPGAVRQKPSARVRPPSRNFGGP